MFVAAGRICRSTAVAPIRTSHFLRAIAVIRRCPIPPSEGSRQPSLGAQARTVSEFDSPIRRAFAYLERHHGPDGSWLPLWFGNQHAPDDENPTYGTSRVLAAYAAFHAEETEPAQKGIRWLLDAQNADGNPGGAKGIPGSVEETALAVDALLQLNRPIMVRFLKESRG